MNPVVHFEMPYENRERMAKFYQSAFGWQTQMFGEDMGNYVTATTVEPDATGAKSPERLMAASFRESRIGLTNIRRSLLRWTISRNR